MKFVYNYENTVLLLGFRPSSEITRAQLRKLFLLASRRANLLGQIGSLNKRIAFEAAKLSRP